MSYLNRVANQRQLNRATEDRRKKAKEAARRSGIAGLGLSAARRTATQEDAGWFKRMLNAMDPLLWKSKRTFAHEAEVARKKAEQEAKDKKA